MRRILVLFTLLILLLAVGVVAQAQDGETLHIVGSTETLNHIALFYNVPVQDIIERNEISNPNLIFSGQRLIIPNAVMPDTSAISTYNEYLVQPGEGLGLIALCFNTTRAEIAALNNIVNPNTIYAGQILNVPGEYICGDLSFNQMPRLTESDLDNGAVTNPEDAGAETGTETDTNTDG